ncbi:hypothetical protein HG421_12085 [Xanthomonas campestris pv. badrii]|uniref:Lipoprotein n=1 Tax=Xanthomonas campestris pv. badrii TaxID=149696 RepID=A0A7Z2ZHS1_XANCA|nr:hypothetical protein HG421_12085 [Xanthomonas campestris pv. badrii]
MRWVTIAISLAALAGCSCQRSADHQIDAATPASTATTSPPPADAADRRVSAPSAADALAAAQARTDLTEAGATVQRYLGALPGSARADADALWTGGRPPPVPDDAVLRAMTDIQSMRINNDPPVLLDPGNPQRRIEVPVRIIVRSASGTQQLVGAYRLQPRAGSNTLEIYSATLHPVLR